MLPQFSDSGRIRVRKTDTRHTSRAEANHKAGLSTLREGTWERFGRRLQGRNGQMSRTESMRLNFRVPGVYLTWAYSVFLSFFSFNRISNLRVFNTAFSSIFTARTHQLALAIFSYNRNTFQRGPPLGGS